MVLKIGIRVIGATKMCCLEVQSVDDFNLKKTPFLKIDITEPILYYFFFIFLDFSFYNCQLHSRKMHFAAAKII